MSIWTIKYTCIFIFKAYCERAYVSTKVRKKKVCWGRRNTQSWALLVFLIFFTNDK